MRTQKLKIVSFVLALGLIVIEFSGINQMYAAEIDKPFVEDENVIENDPALEEIPLEPPVEIIPQVKKLSDVEVVKGKKKKINLKKHKETNFVWASSKPKVATISKNGYVKGISSGKTTITASNGEVVYKCVVKVYASKKYVNEWVLKKGRYYYYNQYGEMATGKVKIGKTTYFFDNEGKQHVGWIKQSGKYYYYQIGKKNKGYMLTNQKVNGITLSKNGVAKVTPKNKKKLQLFVDACDSVFEETNWDMTRKEALKTMFIKLAKNEIISYKTIGHFRNIEQWDVYYANQYFSKGFGDCYTYASAMAYFAIALGYEDVWVCSSGSHGWCQIDGLYYDPRYANWGTSDMMKAFAVPDELCGKGGRMNWKRYSYHRCKVD